MSKRNKGTRVGYDYSHLWRKWPWLAPGAQGVGHPSAAVEAPHDKRAALDEAVENINNGDET